MAAAPPLLPLMSIVDLDAYNSQSLCSQVVELLLEYQADVNRVTQEETALSVAIEQEHEGTAAVLRAAGALR